MDWRVYNGLRGADVTCCCLYHVACRKWRTEIQNISSLHGPHTRVGPTEAFGSQVYCEYWLSYSNQQARVRVSGRLSQQKYSNSTNYSLLPPDNAFHRAENIIDSLQGFLDNVHRKFNKSKGSREDCFRAWLWHMLLIRPSDHVKESTKISQK